MSPRCRPIRRAFRRAGSLRAGSGRFSSGRFSSGRFPSARFPSARSVRFLSGRSLRILSGRRSVLVCASAAWENVASSSPRIEPLRADRSRRALSGRGESSVRDETSGRERDGSVEPRIEPRNDCRASCRSHGSTSPSARIVSRSRRRVSGGMSPSSRMATDSGRLCRTTATRRSDASRSGDCRRPESMGVPFPDRVLRSTLLSILTGGSTRRTAGGRF